jgi:hypothetical protein
MSSKRNPDGELIALADQFKVLWRKFERAEDGAPSEALADQLQPIFDKISQIPATSLAGLRAKTMAAVAQCGHWWDKSKSDLDADHEQARSVIEAACVITGLRALKERSRPKPDWRVHPGSETLGENETHSPRVFAAKGIVTR